MTVSEPSRLDRLEALAETILLAIQQQQGQLGEMRESVQDTVQMVGTLAQESERHWAAIQEVQLEVRGLQTENRRILEILQQRNEGE